MSTRYDIEAREYGQKIILFVRSELKRRGFTQKEFAKRVGVTEGRMKAMLNRPGNLQLSTLLQFAYGLGMRVEDMLASSASVRPSTNANS